MKFLLNRSALFLVFFAIIISVTLTVTRILLIEYGYAKIALVTFPLSIIPIVMIAIPIGRVIKFLFQISKLVLGKIFNNKNYDKIEKIGIKAFDYSNTKIKESKKKSNKKQNFRYFLVSTYNCFGYCSTTNANRIFYVIQNCCFYLCYILWI